MLSAEEQIRVRYAETDQMKFIYYARYFEYFEIGRLSFLRAHGFPYSKMEAKYDYHLPVVETYARYHKPAKLEDILTIETIILKKPAATLRFDYEIRNKKIIIATGYTTHFFLNGKTGKPERPPVELEELFNKTFP